MTNQQKQDCEMCGGHNSDYDDDEDCDTWTSAYENYIVCDDCIPPDAICSVKEWNERWTKKGKNTFDFDEMCWKKKKLKKKIKLIKPKKEEEQMTPTNFKYPNRCSKFWNVEKQKHEWKQYLGSGHYCSPEMIEEEEEEEEICCKCKTDYEVEQCMECDKYICEECDPNRMATYTYNGAGIHCEPCAIAKRFALGALG